MWPTSERAVPEIDAFEFYGDNRRRLTQTLHKQDEASGMRKRPDETVQMRPDWADGWHVFGLDREPGRITWYIDGVATKVVAADTSATDMYLILNLAVSDGSRAPAPNAGTPFPSALAVDYVRVFSNTAGAKPVAPQAGYDGPPQLALH
jgi:beta-glucanase (GH16 family)